MAHVGCSLEQRKLGVISKNGNGIKEMLGVSKLFGGWSQIEINVNKHCRSLGANLGFTEQEILNLTLAQSLKYLGTAVEARRTGKLEAAEANLAEVGVHLKKIMESTPPIAQQIDAVKTFLFPTC
jgi:hypothetical protein